MLLEIAASLLLICRISCEESKLTWFDVYPKLTVSSTGDVENEVINFIGTGYNIYKGNPGSGDDPGQLLTRRILPIDPRKFPEQIEIGKLPECQIAFDYDLIYSLKSYQEFLGKYVEETGTKRCSDDFKFTLSKDYKAMLKEILVFYNVHQEYTTKCDLGGARYKLDLAEIESFPVSKEFMYCLRNLPEQYSSDIYHTFIDTWGTHVVTEIKFGHRASNSIIVKLRDLFKSLLTSILQSSDVFTKDITRGGPVFGFESSLAVNTVALLLNKEMRYPLGLYYHSVQVGRDFISATKLFVTPLHEIINRTWSVIVESSGHRNMTKTKVQKLQANIERAIREYPSHNNASAPKETKLAIPLTWAIGTYSLPKPTSGCPDATWEEGTRYQEADRKKLNNQWTHGHHFDGVLKNDGFNITFCTKTLSTVSNLEFNWPQGKFCIFRRNVCPEGFEYGAISIYDEQNNNRNSRSGQLPDGIYTEDTVFAFCCISTGSDRTPIWLPSSKPFYLLKLAEQCQKIHNMADLEETLYWSSATGNRYDNNPRNQVRDGYIRNQLPEVKHNQQYGGHDQSFGSHAQRYRTEEQNVFPREGGSLPTSQIHTNGDVEITFCYYTPIQ